MTKIDLITGMLGAGKTTFLHCYAQHFIGKGQRIAILVNDFGAVNVDMLLLKDLACENCELAMVAACNDPFCHRRRFKTQLINLGMQHFDRVLLEPSGIFDMDEFFDTLHDSPLDRWFEIGSILTIVDAEAADNLPPQLDYLFASEAACAGKLVLSKLSRITETPEQAAARVLAHLNRALEAVQCDRRFTAAQVLAKEWDALTPEELDALSESSYRAASYVKQFQPDEYAAGVHYFLHVAIPREALEPLLEDIMHGGACGEITRLKGSLPDGAGGWLRVNMTKEKLTLEPAEDQQAVLIVIGEAPDYAEIDSRLRAANTDPAYTSI